MKLMKVRDGTPKRLAALKRHPRETYDDVIDRAIRPLERRLEQRRIGAQEQATKAES